MNTTVIVEEQRNGRADAGTRLARGAGLPPAGIAPARALHPRECDVSPPHVEYCSYS
jgi:hypothetical protein